MDQSLDPPFAQRFAEGQANLPAATLQMLLQGSAGRGPGFGSFQQTPAAFGDLGVQGLQGLQPQLAPTALYSQLLRDPQTLAQLQSPAGSGQADPRPSSSRGRARSGGAGTASMAAPASYASRHQQAEARRRSRINERLEALRKVVPHSERANTATFLEDVLKYVERLQRRVVELEERLGLEPTVKYQPPPRLSDGNTEPSTADNLASQTQQQAANRGSARGAAAQQTLALAATAQQARAPQQEGSLQQAAAAALEQQLGALAGRASVGAVGASAGGSFPARAGLYSSRNSGLSTAAAGGEALPSNSEELALGAALQKGSSAGATAANMAESRPAVGHAALAQLAQQVHLQALAQAARSGPGAGAAGIPAFQPQLNDIGGGALGQGPNGRHLNPALLGRPTDVITAQDLAAATAAVGRPGAAGKPRSSSPLSNAMVQQAAQALLSNSALQQLGLGHQQHPGQQPLSHAALLLAQQQAGINAAAAFDGRDHFGAQGGSLLPGLQPRAPEAFPAGLSQQQLQAQHAQQLQQLLAAQQAQQASLSSHQQQLQQLGLPRALGGAVAQVPLMPAGSGQSAPPPSTSACLSGGTPAATTAAAAAAAAAAAGKELSNSGRSQQTQHVGGGVGVSQGGGALDHGGTGQGEKLGLGLGKRVEREELNGEEQTGGEPKRKCQELNGEKPKLKRLPGRPTYSQ